MSNSPQQLNSSPGLKILIASTPKTGNTWLKHMLHLVYELPMVDIPMTTSGPELSQLGERWICHQHLFPTESILAALRSQNVILITTVRHPADVLVSQFNYLKGWVQGGGSVSADDPANGLLNDGDAPGVNTLAYVRESFASYLLYSAAWLSFSPIVVRYENLRSAPLAELQRVTELIQPVHQRKLEVAVALCEMSVLKKRVPGSAYHFRKGGSQFANKEEKLPDSILQELATKAPYPEINARLGYSYDTPPVLKRFDYSTVNPFHGHETFSNGVPISLGILKLYLALPDETRARWSNPVDASRSDSFFAYLLEPIDSAQPVLTRLCALIYQRRPDLVIAYPQYQTISRWKFINWMIYTGTIEYSLHQALIQPLLSSLLSPRTNPSPSLENAKAELILQLGKPNGTPLGAASASGDWIVAQIEAKLTINVTHPRLILRLYHHTLGHLYGCIVDPSPTSGPAAIVAGLPKSYLMLMQLNVPAGEYRIDLELWQTTPEGKHRMVENQGAQRFTVTGTPDWTGTSNCHTKLMSAE